MMNALTNQPNEPSSDSDWAAENALRLKSLCQTANTMEDSLTVSGIVWLEHVNIVVGLRPLVQVCDFSFQFFAWGVECGGNCIYVHAQLADGEMIEPSISITTSKTVSD
jgi:hypothetical protein